MANLIPIRKLDLTTDITSTETIFHSNGVIGIYIAQLLRTTVKPLLANGKTVVLDLESPASNPSI